MRLFALLLLPVLVLALTLTACDGPPLSAAFWSDAERNQQATSSLCKGLHLLTRGEHEEAHRQLRYAAQLIGNENQGVVQVAQRLLEEGQPDTAGVFLEEIALQPPYRDNPFVSEALAQVCRSKGDTAQTALHHQQALELVASTERLAPMLATAPEAERQARLLQFVLSGRYAIEVLQEPARGVALLWKAVRLNPGVLTETELRPLDSFAVGLLGATLADHPELADEPGQPVRLTRLAAQAQPSSAVLRSAFGWALFRRGDLSGAQRVLREAVDMDSSDAETHYRLGQVYGAQGDSEAARREYDATLLLRPHHAGAESARKKLSESTPAAPPGADRH